jgi:hypothetical protein
VTTAELLNGVSAFEGVSLSIARGGPVPIAP